MNLQDKPFDPNFPSLLQAQETTEDLLGVVFLQAYSNEVFAVALMKGFVTAYIAKCIQLKIEIDAFVSSFTNI